MSQSDDSDADAKKKPAGASRTKPEPSPYPTAYPAGFFCAEAALLRRRPKWSRPYEIGAQRVVGVGLSGGGIRSATFCLGVFQAMAKLGLLGEIDYVSSVSGGSYFAAFYGRLFARPDIGGVGEIEQIISTNQKERSAAGSNKRTSWKAGIFDWTRDNGRYLAPKGGGDLLLGIATALRNWLTVQLIIAISVTAIFLIAQLLRVSAQRFEPPTVAQGLWWRSPYLTVTWLAVLLWVVPSGAAYWLFRQPEPPPQDEAAGGKAAAGSAAETRGGLISLWAVTGMLFFFGAAAALAGVVSGRIYEVAALAALSFLLMLAFAGRAACKARPKSSLADRDLERRLEPVMRYENTMARCDDARNRLSAMLRTALAATLAMLAFGLIDSAGQMLYARHFCKECTPGEWLGGIYAALAAFAPFARWVAGALMPKKKHTHSTISLSLVAGVAAAVVFLPALVGLDMFSHAIAYGFQKPADAPAALMTSSKAMPVEISLRIEGAAPKQIAPAGPLKLAHPSVTVGVPQTGATRQESGSREALPLAVALILAALFSYIVGAESPRQRTKMSAAMVFLNRTSLHPIYTARLIRAYLGASNQSRYGDGKGVTEVVAGDDISHERYWFMPEKFFYRHGAPLHIVNMTLNETIGGESQIEQRDRKGLGMAVGPAGLSVGVRHHAIYQEPEEPKKIVVQILPDPKQESFRVFDYAGGSRDAKGNWIAEFKGEQLSLGNWTGVSGAAATTGMGFRTSLGLSLLAAFFNVRLGYWWDSGIKTREPSRKWSRRIGSALSYCFPVQGYLVDEFLSRFHGTSRQRWYLSDGGNFENLGGYELIRRRLPLMIIIDAGCDPDYDFDDLSGLVRKARLDFNAEIQFLSAAEIQTELKGAFNCEIDENALIWYGPLEHLRRGKRADEPAPPPSTERTGYFKSSDPVRYSLKHAAFARVKYLDDPAWVSHLILIKPTMVGDEPADVIQYHNSHPSFPHQGTSDQFFDEAQWESYRRLGQHIAEKIFAAPEEGKIPFLPKSKREESKWYWRC